MNNKHSPTNLYMLENWVKMTLETNLKGVFAKNESGYRRNAKNKRF